VGDAQRFKIFDWEKKKASMNQEEGDAIGGGRSLIDFVPKRKKAREK